MELGEGTANLVHKVFPLLHRNWELRYLFFWYGKGGDHFYSPSVLMNFETSDVMFFLQREKKMDS